MEPILNESNKRYTVYPIQYKNIWDSYQKQLASFWKAQEIDFTKDYDDFMELNEDEQRFIKHILAFFAASDGIVNFNISSHFLKEVQIMEALVAYSFQMAMENIHGETYSLMLDNIVRNKEEKETLFRAIETVPSVKAISDWAFKWIDDKEASFASRLIAFAVIEGVLFSGAFAAIFWIKKYKSGGRLFMQGLIKSNEFIARDEGMHTDFACEMYSLLRNRLPRDQVLRIVREGVEIAQTFMRDALPVRLIGMNSDHMDRYLEFVADRLLSSLGYTVEWNSKNPFPFMETIGMLQKTNFFESRPTEYQSAHVLAKSKTFEIVEDF
jgi:ribonucleotide reductase beta subunit family protein with ferritin-like domain